MPSNSHPTLPLAGSVQASKPTGGALPEAMLVALSDAHRAAAFWQYTIGEEAKRKTAVTSTREIRANGNHLAAQNDEPEPMPRRSAAFRKLDESINAEIRAERALQPELDGVDKGGEFSPRGKV